MESLNFLQGNDHCEMDREYSGEVIDPPQRDAFYLGLKKLNDEYDKRTSRLRYEKATLEDIRSDDRGSDGWDHHQKVTIPKRNCRLAEIEEELDAINDEIAQRDEELTAEFGNSEDPEETQKRKSFFLGLKKLDDEYSAKMGNILRDRDRWMDIRSDDRGSDGWEHHRSVTIPKRNRRIRELENEYDRIVREKIRRENELKRFYYH